MLCGVIVDCGLSRLWARVAAREVGLPTVMVGSGEGQKGRVNSKRLAVLDGAGVTIKVGKGNREWRV